MTDMRPLPFADGPFIRAAMLCESILIEANGVKTAVRIVDRVLRSAVVPNLPSEMEPFDHTLWLFVSFISGTMRGSLPFQVKMERPSGVSTIGISQSIFFEGEGDRGQDIIGPMTFKFDLTGLYWFDVILDDIRVTRIPLRVIYNPIGQAAIGRGGRPPQEGPGNEL